MKESERLCRKGVEALQRAGWPPEAVQEVVTDLMGAGMAYERELRIDEANRNEALIAKAVSN